MFQRLLICTDLDDGMQRLVNFVPSLAACGVQQITFLHSVPLWEEGGIPRKDVEKIEAAEKFLSCALENVPDGVNVTIAVESGKPIEAIRKTVDAMNPDIILLGAARRTLLREKLFGSTTIEIVQRIQLPLLVLRPTMLAAYTSEELDLRCRHLFRYLLVPYDGSPATEDVLKQLKQYAEKRPSDSLEALFLCWVVEDSGIRGLAKENTANKAREILPALKDELASSLALQVGFDLRQGNPIEETLEAAETIDVSAIAVSTERLGGFLELSGRSLTGEMLRRSFYPVLFFPYQR